MEKNIIFYFSGTGNSLKAAQDIASVLGDTELVFMKGSFELNGRYDRIGFVFPCYAAGAPEAAVRFIKRLPLNDTSSDYVFSVVTYNREDGNASAMVNTELIKKGLSLNYNSGIQMVGNYIVLYDIPENPSQLLSTAAERMGVVAGDIKNKVTKKDCKKNPANKVFHSIGNRFFRAKEKKFTVSDNCISCGLCKRLCPVDNIEMQDGKPVFLHKNCQNCMACIHWCPQKAINCGHVTTQRKRYHHPGITSEELLKRNIKLSTETESKI